MSRKRKVFIAVMGVLLLYVSSYTALSRRAYRVADAYQFEGYFFVLPTDDERMLLHILCVAAYYPLIKVDEIIGSGRSPGRFAPLWNPRD